MLIDNTNRSLIRRILAKSKVQDFQNDNESPKSTCKNSKIYFKLFLSTSSIHGLNHMVAPGRHALEVLLWLTTVGFSIFGATYLSQITWARYQSSPTVVSMDRDMYAWNTTFPCVTLCSSTKVDIKLVEEYVMNSEEPNKELLRNFIVELANANYNSFDKIPEYNKISPEDYMQLIFNLSLAFNPTLTIGVSGIILNVVPTITEMGLCFAINSRVASYNSPEYRDANRWDLLKKYNRTLYIHPLDGEVFAQVVNITAAYDVYIHGPQEFPDISMKYQHSEKKHYLKLYVTAVTVYTSAEAAMLSVSQRRCRFPYENNLRHNSIYSYNLCRMECRIRLCLEYCKCIPHFYRRIGKEKICDVQGLKCLSDYKDDLYKLRSNKTGEKLDCDCYPLCDDVNYVLQSNILQEWFLSTNLQWGMVTYPRMRYRRDIIFGFTDVLVAVGGMAGLFLGCSVLSFMEIIYFMTLRLVCYARNPDTSKVN